MNVDKLSPTCVDNYINCFVTLINVYASLCLNFFHLLAQKPNLGKFPFIQTNSFKIFTCPNPFYLSWASGKWVSAKTVMQQE
jgi:hypothetical protein